MADRNFISSAVSGVLPDCCEIEGCERKPHTRWKKGIAVCNLHWQRLHKYGSTDAPEKRNVSPLPPCGVSGCSNRARSRNAGLCEMHYMRVRRHGDTDRLSGVKPGLLVQSGGGYLLEYAPDHPLRVGESPRVYVHRRVFYDAHGAGPFQCHCCGKQVDWADMHVDHLNDDVTDNRIENLAPACPVCNQKRGQHKMALTTKIRRGKLLTAHGITMCTNDWSRHLGVSRNAIDMRIKRGWKMSDALSPRKYTSGPESRKKAVPLSECMVLQDTRTDRSRDWTY